LGQISNSLNIMIGHMETANATTRQLESSLNSAISSSITSSISGLSQEMQRVAQNTEVMSTNIERALTRISSGASRATENVGIFGRMFKGAFGQYFLAELMSEAVWRVAEALFQVPGAVIDLADEFASTQARIGLITDDVQGLSDAIYQASLRSRGSYAQMADTVAKLGLTARNAFKSTEEIVPFVENIQKMFAIGGTGTAQQQASLLQLRQALGSGKLQGDEFRSIAENAPMLEQIISKYMGVTQGELKDLAKDGEITASIMRNAILGATDEIEAKFKNMPRTFGQNMQLLGTIAFNAFTPFWQQLSAIADSPAMNQIFDGFYMGVTLAGKALAGLVNNIRWFVGVIGQAYTATKDFINPFVGGLLTTIGLLAIFKTSLIAVSAISFLSGGIRTLITMIQLLPTAISLIRSLGLAQALASMSALEMWGSLILPIGLVLGAIYLIVDAFGAWQTVAEYALSFLIGALMTAFYTVTVLAGAWLVWNGLKFIGTLYELAYAGVVLVTNSYLAVMYIRTLAVAGAQAVLNAIISMNPLPFLIGLIFVVISAFVGWQVASNGLRNTLVSVFSEIASAIASAINFIIDKINGLISAFNAVKSASNEIFGTGFSTTGEISWRADTYAWKSAGASFGNSVADFIENPMGSIQEAMGNVMPSSVMSGAGGYDFGAIPPMDSLGGAGKEGKAPKPVKVKGGKLDKDQQITLAEENLQLITDLARKEVILNYQQLTPQVTITMGDIRETADVDTVIDRLETRLTELYDGSLQGGV
jgi:tape measure domain-containing protein